MAATIGTVVILAFVFFLLGRKYPVARGTMGGSQSPYPGQGQAVSHGREDPQLVQEDVRQMLAAQNALKQKRGAPAMSVEDLRAAVAEDDRNRSRGRGPFSME